MSGKQQRGSRLVLALILLWIVLLALFYWQRERAHQAYEEWRALQQYAQRWEKLRHHLPAGEAAPTPVNQVIQRSARKHHIKLLEVSERQNGEFEVRMSPLSYVQLVDWLAAIQRQEGVVVHTLTLTSLAEPGTVGVDVLRLRRL